MYYSFISWILVWQKLRDFEMSLIEVSLFLNWFLVCIAREGRSLCSWWSLVIPFLMIASSTFHTSHFCFLFISYFFSNQLTHLLLTSWFSGSHLYFLLSVILLPCTLTSIILCLLLEIGNDEVNVVEFLLPLGWVWGEVFVVCHSLSELRVDTVHNDIDNVVVSHLGICPMMDLGYRLLLI